MLRFISVSDILNCRDIPWNVLTNNHKDLKGHNYYVPFFYYVYDVFYFYNIMMSGLSPDDYNDNLSNLSIISFLYSDLY